MPPRKRQQLPVTAAFQTISLHPPSSAVSLANVDDLLIEILVRLPAKSLSRFKCVCKKWLSLIPSDHLCHLHTLRRPKLQPSIILHTSYPRYPHLLWYTNPTISGEMKMIPFSLSLPIPAPDYEIVQACNGLMLLKLQNTKIRYYIHNPTTRRSREIIISTNSNKFSHVAAMGLAFDPSKSPYYKIVCVRSIGFMNSLNLYLDPSKQELYTYQIEVYDSESHTWKLSLEPFLDDRPFNTFGTYWNNAIYWRFSNGESCYYRCFDICKNELKTIPFPQTPQQSRISRIGTYLQESDGNLYHFELELFPKYKESVRVLVWDFVGDDDSQWIFKYDHRLTCTADCKHYILRSRSIGRSGSGSDGDGTCSLLTYGGQAGMMRAYSFLDKSYGDLVDLTTQPGYQQGSYNRLNVKCFQFGEVLALV